MNANELNRIFLTLADTSKPKQKQLLLETCFDSDVFQRVLRAALDPFVTYGMTALPASQPQVELREHLDAEFWSLLERLAKREITGNHAKFEVATAMSKYTSDVCDILLRIVTKDLRCGVTATLVNKVWPKLIPEYSCMLAKDYDAAKQSFPCWWEPKLDGFRVNVHVDTDNGTVDFVTRSGLSYGETLNHLKDYVLEACEQFAIHHGKPFSRLVLDAEAISGSFAETSSSLRKKSKVATDAWLNLFDVVTKEEFDAGKSTNEYEVRRQMLLDILAVSNPDGALRLSRATLAHSHADLDAAYEFCRDRGDEGIMVKDCGHLYETKRSAAWRKRKPEDSREFMVVGSFEGEGKYFGMLGGLTVDVDGVSVNVGTGLTDKQRADLWPVRFDLPGRLVEVEYMEKTPDGSLRHPRLKRFRDTIEAGVKE
jgi:DNA ligase-1